MGLTHYPDGIVTDELQIGTPDSSVNYTAAVQALAGKPLAATIGAPSAEAAEARTCAVQLKDFAGADLAVRGVVTAFVSTDAAGDTPVDGATTIALTAGTDGAVLPGADAGARAQFVSEADGDIDIVLTDSAGATGNVYLHIVGPLGNILASSAVIAFAA